LAGGLRIFISAGEVSGDLYAAQLVEALRRVAGAGTRLQIAAVAGPRTRAAGVRLLQDATRRAALGFVAPLPFVVPSLISAARIRRLVGSWRPHVVVLVDYPGFNIPLAGMLADLGVAPIAYYLPPEECLWGRKGKGRLDRTRQVVRACSCLLTTHDADTAFYTAEGGSVTRVGHPLVDLVPVTGDQQQRRCTEVALLPASRRQELSLLWPTLADTAARMVSARPGLELLVPLAAAHLERPLQRAMARAQRQYPGLRGRLHLLEPTSHDPYPTLAAARRAAVAISKSGSVTLELALAGVPHLLLFRIDRVTEWLGRRVMHLSEADFPHMALPSFILGRALVPEFKCRDVDPERIAATALDLLEPRSAARAAQIAGFAELREVLGGTGAAERGARTLLALARQQASASGQQHR
jgi:lipid-A-disaccharide synthase